MKKKALIISLAAVLGLALFLAWWNGYTPLVSRATIERWLDRALTIDYEYVSSERVRGRRWEKHYTYRDANGMEFTVRAFKEREGVYASGVHLWWYNSVECDYTQAYMAQYFGDIKALFGSRLNPDPPEYRSYVINVYSYEQLSQTAEALAGLFTEIPPYPINREAYDERFGIDPEQLIVDFRYGEEYTYAKEIGYFRFLCVGEEAPNRDEILLSLEDAVASLYKSGKIDIEIPYDVLIRKPPLSFESVMIGDVDICPRLAWGVRWNDDYGQYLFSTYIFGGEQNSFAYMIGELGGSYERISPSYARWSISGDIWEARKKGSKRVHAGHAEYTVDTISITKNGEELPALESPQSAMYTLQDIEMLLGVKTEYTNDVATLYLIPDTP